MPRESMLETAHIMLLSGLVEIKNQYNDSSASQQIFIEWRTGYGVAV